jgi:hypothetical protein
MQKKTREALDRAHVAEFRDLAGVTFGRLTPAGVTLRDAYIRGEFFKAPDGGDCDG